MNNTGSAQSPASPPPDSPPPPSPGEERALRRDDEGRMLTGVCAGLGRYAGIDPVVLRVGFAVLVLGSGLGIMLYVAAFLLMRETDGGPGYMEQWTRRAFDSETVLALLAGVFALGLVLNLSSGGIGTGTVVVGTLFAIALLAAHARGVDLLAVMRSLPDLVRGRRSPSAPGRRPASPFPAFSPPSGTTFGPSPFAGETPAAAPPVAETLRAASPVTASSGTGTPGTGTPGAHPPGAETLSGSSSRTETLRTTSPLAETPGAYTPGAHPPGAVPPAPQPGTPRAGTPQAGPFREAPTASSAAPYPTGARSFDSSGEPFSPYGPYRPLDPRKRQGPYSPYDLPGYRPPVEKIPAAKRPRSYVGGLTMFLAMIVGGVVVAIQSTSGSVNMTVTGGAVLVTIGAGLLVATWFGRGAALVAVGAFVSIAVIAGSMLTGMPRKFGSYHWEPTTLSEVAPDYALGIGEGTLDLSELPLVPGSRTVFNASVSLGEITVILPATARVEVRSHTKLGDVKIDHSVRSGPDTRYDKTLEPELPPKEAVATIVLNVTAGIGDVEVRRGV